MIARRVLKDGLGKVVTGNPREWVRSCNNYFQRNHTPENVKMAYVASNLERKKIFQRFEAYMRDHGDNVSWAKFSDDICTKFGLPGTTEEELDHITTNMEEATWQQRLHALTHILTNPEPTPPLHSQFFISTQVPCYLNWHYPPLLCPKPLLHKWAISLFLKRLSRFGLPETSWRSKCPYHQPPPVVLAKGVAEAEWGDEEKRLYVRQRLRRKPLVSNVHPLIPILVPNLLLLSVFLWNPYPDDP
nr:uncharacterized protein LOC7456773 isoform X1 [Ipomoea trifida]